MSRAAPAIASLEEARMEQAAEAARTARRNQPRGLLVLAGVLMLLALIYVGVAAMGRASAAEELDASKEQAEEALRLAGTLKAQRAAQQAGPVQVQAATALRTRIEQAGVEAGMKTRVPLPQTRTELPPGLGSKQVILDYTVQDEDVSALLQWVKLSVAAVPGLEVDGVTLRPEAHAWNLRVKFSRWEKVEGS